MAEDSATAPTLLEILRKTTEFLKSKNCDSPRLEAELLLAKGLGIRRLDLYLQFDRPMLEDDLVKCRELVRRRGAREPIAYILGEREFRSLPFEVNPDVFIPRPDTETVVEEAVKFLKTAADRENCNIADIGTGSGCLAVSIAKEVPGARVTATDVSSRAIVVAARNAARSGVDDRVKFVETPWLDRVDAEMRFRLIVSNPPYVLSTELAGLQPELKFEPRLALSPPGDAIGDVFDNLTKTGAARLASGGALMVEIGEGQAGALSAAFQAAGFVKIRVARDLGGIDRVVIGEIL